MPSICSSLPFQTLYSSMKDDEIKEAHKVQLVILERNKIKEDLRKNQKELEEYTEYAQVTERKSQTEQVACMQL